MESSTSIGAERPGLNKDLEMQRRLVAAGRQQLEATETPGAAVALLVDGQPVLESGIGYRDLERTLALQADAPFYIYSVTKTLLGVTVLQLVAQGAVSLDHPIQRYLPELPLDTPVTVRQLLNHTGGIPDYGGLPAYFEAVRARPGQPWTADEFLDNTLAQGLAFSPGRGWGYSNIGYLILRLLLQAVTGESFRHVLQQSLFEPLQLTRTFVAETLADARHLTPGYSTFFSSDNGLENATALYHPGWVSHGVVISTAAELAHLFEQLFTGQLLPRPLMEAMLTPVSVPHRHPLFRGPAYGLGVMIDADSPYGVTAGHGGGGPGYAAAALHFTNVGGKRVTAVALANRDHGEIGMQMVFAMTRIIAEMERI